MTATRSTRQRGMRRLAAATAGLVTAAGAGVAVLAVHDASTAHATTKPTNSGSTGTDQNSVGSGSGSSLTAPESQSGGGQGGTSSSSRSDATSGGS